MARSLLTHPLALFLSQTAATVFDRRDQRSASNRAGLLDLEKENRKVRGQMKLEEHREGLRRGSPAEINLAAQRGAETAYTKQRTKTEEQQTRQETTAATLAETTAAATTQQQKQEAARAAQAAVLLELEKRQTDLEIARLKQQE